MTKDTERGQNLGLQILNIHFKVLFNVFLGKINKELQTKAEEQI